MRTESSHANSHDASATLKHTLDHAAHLLPMQGPIGVFIHHNTLHAFQHLSFEQAVVEASQVFGTKPFLNEADYRVDYERGRITDSDLELVLNDEPDAAIWTRGLTRRALRRAMLVPGLRSLTAENIEWQIEEGALLDQVRRDLDAVTRQNVIGRQTEAAATRALFTACYQRYRYNADKNNAPQRPAHPRQALQARCDEDIEEAFQPLLIRLCAVFLDQGQAYWPMPERERGFYVAVRELMRKPFTLERVQLRGLQREWQRQADKLLSAKAVVLHWLERFSVAPEHWDTFLTAELLCLPGWAGLMRRLEEDPSLAPYEALPCSLMDFLAVRLTLMAVAAEQAWQNAELDGSVWSHWQQPLPAKTSHEAEHMAAVAHLFDVAQLLGLSAGQLNSLSEAEFSKLADEVNAFDDLERRRVWHLAYERQHERLILAPLQTHRATINPMRDSSNRPAAQVLFCIDEREESMRRALEEFAPNVETLGAAGFFGVAMNYRGLDDAHAVALCPVVVTPQHAIVEKPAADHADLHERRQQRRQVWATLTHNSWVGSRTLVRGMLSTAVLGLISLFPLITRVLAPLRAGQLYRWLGERFLPDPRTEVTLMRQDATGHDLTEGLMLGFTVQEKAERVAGLLRAAGVIEKHARIFVVLGHGSTSLNNPHESAHDCGACGGRRGGPNARLFAAMANHSQVRETMRSLGVVIPDDTWFVGGYHDTCNDDVIYFDEADIPATHAADFAFIRQALDAARAGNALERSRRFEAAYRDETPAAALRHVQERADHLAEPRPEYGHATNAVAIVGRRSLTRGLFLDRRAFLISYDATIDAEDQSLAALLGAAGPVCAGINLEYYFSFVDNERYGCGTKLPHNVTGLVGVMNGHASDLRTGLPWQMVEVHEPVRLLLICETSPERFLNAAWPNAGLRELVENRWIRVVTCDPVDGKLHVFRNGEFEPFTERLDTLPVVANSPAWFQGKLEHLPIVRVAAAAA